MSKNKIPLLGNSLIVQLILLAIFILFFTLSFFSEGSAGGADTYVHYFFSKESWHAPYLFLDHWGKPIFTLLSSPFAQFGYNGIKVFNILLGLLSAFAAYRIALVYKFKFKIPVIFLILFAPVYTLLLMTGMTEILFGTFLIVSTWLYIEKKFLFSAILISFIIFVRTEGIAFIFVWIVLLAINKKFKILPFLLTGFILYGIIGYFYFYHDFFWFFTKNPYINVDLDYGKGELLFYVKRYKETFGYLMTALTGLGLVAYLIFLYKSWRGKNFLPAFTETALIAGIPIIYFVMHSFLWWKGLMHVLGDIRFMSAIIPFCGLIAIKGLQFVFQKIEKPIIIASISVLLIAVAVVTPFRTYEFPVPLKDENIVIKKAIDWLKTTPEISKRILFYNPYVPLALDRDPFKDTTMLSGILSDANPEKMKPGDIFIWDTHFAAYEGRIKLDSISNDINYELLRVFNPDVSFTVMNNDLYSVRIYKKISEHMTGERAYTNDTLMLLTFDNDTLKDMTEFPLHSGNKVMPLNKNRVFSSSFETQLSQVNGGDLFIMNAKVDVYFPAKTKTEIYLVASVENETGPKYYTSKTVTEPITEGINTIELNEQYFLPEVRNYILKVYVYTADNKEVLIDNLQVIRKYPLAK